MESEVRTVFRNQETGKWGAYVILDGARIDLGEFEDMEQAFSGVIFYRSGLVSKPPILRQVNPRKNETKGVCYHRPSDMWMIRVIENGKQKTIAYFRTKETAERECERYKTCVSIGIPYVRPPRGSVM